MENKEPATNGKWTFSDSSDTDRVYVPINGRQLAQLVSIEQRMTKKFESPDELEPKLLYVFAVCDKKLERLNPGESASATMWLRPSMFRSSGKGRTAKMVEMLDSMSESGRIPNSALESREAYQTYAESMIGQFFTITCEHRNGFNNVKSVAWASPHDVTANLNKELLAEVEVKKPQNSQVDFSGYKDHASPKDPPPNGDKRPQTHYYDISGLAGEAEKTERATRLLGSLGGTWSRSSQVWSVPAEIPQLVKFKVDPQTLTESAAPPKQITLDEDEIPF